VNEPESGIAVALHTADPGDSGTVRRQSLLAPTMRGRTQRGAGNALMAHPAYLLLGAAATGSTLLRPQAGVERITRGHGAARTDSYGCHWTVLGITSLQ
jgi:hypothetical protein